MRYVSSGPAVGFNWLEVNYVLPKSVYCIYVHIYIRLYIHTCTYMYMYTHIVNTYICVYTP